MFVETPAGFETRPATLQDLEAVVALINAAALADIGMKRTTHEERLTEWTLPQFNLNTDTRLVYAPNGRLAGYVELWDGEPHVRFYQFGRVHPDFRGRGIGGFLLDWAKARARQSLPLAPAEARVSFHTSAPQQDQAAHRLFESRGLAASRYFFHMLIEMPPDVPPPAPQPPPGVNIRPLMLNHDERAVHRTLDTAFQDHWGYVAGESFEEWMHWIEMDSTFDPDTCFVAAVDGSDGGQCVGAIMTHPQFEGDPSIAWVDDLGVLRPWRRKGLALALLYSVFAAYFQRGKYRVGLGVDAQSLTGALGLYEKAGMRILQRIDAYAKTLRPGVDLSVQSLEA
ncbi:MAG: GNAT family N-acetyltransferase [Chloroflexota bacterium]